jgi:hypothetical protein
MRSILNLTGVKINKCIFKAPAGILARASLFLHFSVHRNGSQFFSYIYIAIDITDIHHCLSQTSRYLPPENGPRRSVLL